MLNRNDGSFRVCFVALVCAYSVSTWGWAQDDDQSTRKQLLEVTKKWDAKLPKEYYVEAVRFSNSLRIGARTQNVDVVVALFVQDLIAKASVTGKAGDAGNPELTELRDLVFLLSNLGVSDQSRNSIARLLACYLGLVRSERIANFHALPVSVNVAQPKGVPGSAGMSPNAISDPQLRDEYERAIRQNNENELANRRQADLKRIERQISRSVMNYIAKVYSGKDKDSVDLQECLRLSKATDQEREEVMSGNSRVRRK